MTAVKRIVLAAALVALAGCQQKMADQPAHRPYEVSEIFPHGQSARPLERGVIHRNQSVADDPLVTWLTPQGKKPKVDPDWKAVVDPNGTSAPPEGAPSDPANFVAEFPFEMTEADFKRGQSLYSANCAVCHGAAGHGNGKIAERGVLKPPSYHVDPAGQAKDSSIVSGADPVELPIGSSRGFSRYGFDGKRKPAMKLSEVPVGYIFQVITWGYGGMGSHETQIPDPADRWRVTAYVRALQLSQGATVADLPAAQQAAIKAGGSK